MSTTELPQRPVLQSLDVESDYNRRPLSALAVVAFVLGLLSLFAIFSTILLPLSIMAIAVGIVVVWKLSRDKEVGGSGLAQAGLAMAAASVFWSINATAGYESYLYSQAAEHAKVLVDTLASGAKYEALELRLVESSRQLTGTNLEEYYNQQSNELKEESQNFLEDLMTRSILDSGPEADWQYVRGVNVSNIGNEVFVVVEMKNKNAEPPEFVHVKMRRQTGLVSDDPDGGKTTALWNFADFLRPLPKS